MVLWFFRVAGEGINVRCMVYFLIGLLLAMIGVIYFTRELKSTSKTPAESRNLNAACELWFFDNHDIWHFTSAGGLFFLFLALMTLEDNNFDTPWEKITVF